MKRGGAVPASARRTFDAASVRARAEARAQQEQQDAATAQAQALAPLDATRALGALPNFEAAVGRRQIVVAGSRERGGGFYCRYCDTLHKDSNRYLKHINGRMHLARIGMSPVAPRATLEDVVQAFEVERRIANPGLVIAAEAQDEEEDDKDTVARTELGLPASFGGSR